MYGELDPKDPHKTIINDIDLAPANAAGKVEYMATFFLVKPIDMSQSSHLMWQEVRNGGGRITLATASRQDGDIERQERYGDHACYVAAVTAAADRILAEGFLLKADHDAPIAQAAASNVLNP